MRIVVALDSIGAAFFVFLIAWIYRNEGLENWE